MLLTHGARRGSWGGMARPLRILIPDGWYHRMSRGNRRATLFWDNTDRRRFLGLCRSYPNPGTRPLGTDNPFLHDEHVSMETVGRSPERGRHVAGHIPRFTTTVSGPFR
jgi:hypothetical protein